MAILLKGPYSRKDYINIQDNLEEQTDNLGTRIEQINNSAILITAMIAALYCIGTLVYLWPHRYEPLDTITSYWIGGGVSILIIALISYFIAVRPYRKQIKDLLDESEKLEKHYRDNMVEVPLSEYIDHISVKGDKVTFPPLDEVDERYLYDTWSYNLADEDHSTQQIMRIYENFYERDFLNTYYNREIRITREECLMLKAKGKRG